jgi:hypothetical protein
LRLVKFVQILESAVLLLMLASSSLCIASPPDAAALPRSSDTPAFCERFLNPPAESRMIKIIHGWPDDSSAQDALIKSLSCQGFGGVVCNVSFSEYLQSETKWTSFTRAVQAAKEAGFSLWLYDEKGYPSGEAGGLVLRGHPEWEAHGLLIADSATESGSITLDLPPGKSFLVAAFPIQAGRVDLARMTNLAAQVRDGKLSWQAPGGRWHLMAVTESRLFEGTHASMSLADHIPYPNLLDPEPVARFLNLTHDAYARRLGNDLGKSFVSTFTDEPSLMSLFLRPMPYRVLPWSSNLAVEFAKRRGRALEPLVPALVVDADPTTGRARYEYWQTVGELVSESYFGQIQQWCEKHHVLSGGHLLMEENLVNQVPLYGDFFRCLRRLDAPSIDCLTSLPEQVPWFIARLASSAAELENRTVTMCETSDHAQRYRPAGDQRQVRTVNEQEIRGTCNRLIVGGIDTITSYYSFAGLSPEQLRRLNDWVGRCCTAVKGGHQVADIAVLYPVESVWPRFTPSRHYANDCSSAARVETVFHDASETLYGAGRDFTYIDSKTLLDAKVEKGVLVHGNLRWRVVVLPSADTLPLEAWENLSGFVRAGGVLIALATLPANSETDFPSARVQTISREIFGVPGEQIHVLTNASGGGGIFVPGGSAGLLPMILNGVLEPDLKLARSRSPLRYSHRRIEGREVYFVINDSSKPCAEEISLGEGEPGEQADPATGSIQAVPRPDRIRLSLPAYGAAIFRIRTAHLPKRLPMRSGEMPGLLVHGLPEVKPLVARGEFVREEIQPDSFAEAGGPAWRVTGTITKDQVDTFLFVRFLYDHALGLMDGDALVVATSVPEGQHAPAQLLVILHEKDGADYLAMTGRLLGAPGHDRTFIPLDRFQLAGWSSDANAHLDLSNITEIRIGWGGYYGKIGENLQFTLSSPARAGAP